MGRWTTWIALSLIAACGAAPAYAWTSPVSITNLAVYREVGPAITHDGYGNLYTVWFGAGSTSGSDGNSALWRVWLQSHNGSAWTAPMANPLSATGAASPHIFSDDSNNLHAVWDQNQEIYYSRRSAGAWSTPLNLTNNPNKSIIPKVAATASGTSLLVTWHEQGHTNDTYDIITRKYTNGTWEAPVNISNDNGISSEPRVAADASGNFHVIWQDGDTKSVYYRQRSAAGTWGARHTLDVTSYRSGTGAIAVGPSGVVHVLYSDDTPRGSYGDWELYHRFFDGSTWSPPVNISNNPGTDAPDDIGPSVAFDIDGNLHAVWHDYSRVWYSKRVGSSWTTRTSLYGPVYTLGSPSITVNTDKGLHVVWQSRPTQASDWDVYYTSEGGTPSGPRGTLSGFVRDQLNLGVAGATVGAGAEIAVTGNDGSYALQLSPGTYSATASKQYYSPQTLTNISITADATTARDFVIISEAPAAPALFSVTPGNTQNVLVWKNSSSANFTGTRIRYQVDFPPGGPEDGTLLLDRAGAPNASETFTHNGLTNGATLYYSAFSYYEASARFYSPGVEAVGTPAGPADFDRDGDVDQDDFGVFQACLGGPGASPQPACHAADLQGDLDVDPTDFDLFVGCYSGPGFAADPGCLP